MRPEPLCSRTGSDIFGVGFSCHHLLRVIFQRTGDKLRGRTDCHRADIVLVLMHILCVGKVTQEFFNQILLLDRRRKQSLAVIYFINTFTGSDVFQISACLIARPDEFKLGNQFRHFKTSA